MLKSAIAIVSLAMVVCMSTSIAMADDASEIQALVTANLTARGFQQPGVFYQFDLTTSLPFAYVQILLGTSGNAGMTFALSKASGTWKILGSGGGYMVASGLVDYGIPNTTAESLQGFACHNEPRKSASNSRTPTVIFFSTSVAMKQLVAKHGPSVLPKRNVLTHINGRLESVPITRPLSGRVCLGL